MREGEVRCGVERGRRVQVYIRAGYKYRVNQSNLVFVWSGDAEQQDIMPPRCGAPVATAKSAGLVCECPGSVVMHRQRVERAGV